MNELNQTGAREAGADVSASQVTVSEKGFVPALLLCFFLGSIGVHRFYVGKIGTGVLMIFTFGGLGIWTLVDFVMIAVGAFKDKQGLPIRVSH